MLGNFTHIVPEGPKYSSFLQLQEEQQRSALQQMISADRQSLLAEVRDLRSTLSLSRLEKHDDHSKLADQLNILQEQYSKRERQLKRQRKCDSVTKA